jgi:dihydrofolate reductase
MMKCSVFIATSLDGYIADSEGGIDWLASANLEGEDYGYQVFADATDVLIMGRNTFEKVMSFPQWPYGDKPVVVVSRAMAQLPDTTPSSVELTHEEPHELIAKLQQRGFEHAYIDGGQLIQSFLAQGLIHSMTLTTLPMTLGAGIPLFQANGKALLQTWQLQGQQAFENGVVQSVYQMKA